MSIFGKLFSSGNKNKAESTQEAIQRLRGIEEMLTKKSEFLEKKITIELTTAKKHGTKDKRGTIPNIYYIRTITMLLCYYTTTTGCTVYKLPQFSLC